MERHQGELRNLDMKSSSLDHHYLSEKMMEVKMDHMNELIDLNQKMVSHAKEMGNNELERQLTE